MAVTAGKNNQLVAPADESVSYFLAPQLITTHAYWGIEVCQKQDLHEGIAVQPIYLGNRLLSTISYIY